MNKELHIDKLVTIIYENIIVKLFLLLAIFAISLSVAYYLAENQKSKYTSEADIYADISSGPIILELTEALNMKILNKEYGEVAQLMNLEKSKVEILESIKAVPNNVNKKLFRMNLILKESVELNLIQKGLMNYFKSNTLIMKIDSAKTKRYKNSIDYVNSENNEIDSFMRNYITKSQVLDYGKIVETQFVLNDKKNEFEFELDMINLSLEYLMPFSKPFKIKVMKKYLIIGTGIAISVVLMLLILIMVLNKEKFIF